MEQRIIHVLCIPFGIRTFSMEYMSITSMGFSNMPKVRQC